MLFFLFLFRKSKIVQIRPTLHPGGLKSVEIKWGQIPNSRTTTLGLTYTGQHNNIHEQLITLDILSTLAQHFPTLMQLCFWYSTSFLRYLSNLDCVHTDTSSDVRLYKHTDSQVAAISGQSAYANQAQAKREGEINPVWTCSMHLWNCYDCKSDKLQVTVLSV